MTVYPSAIDSTSNFTTVNDNITPLKSVIIKELRDTIIAMESELGSKPSGTYTTVKLRLSAIEDIIATLIASGGASSTPIGPAAGHLGGFYPNPVVLNFSLLGEANNTVPYFDGSVWKSALLKNANVDPAAAIAGTKINPDFGSQNITTTGTINAPFASVGEVLNITALKALVSPAANTKIFVKGYTTINDGGEGDFYWDSASTAADNGGTIIALNIVGVGRWKRIFSGAINVKWFGAISEPILTYSPTTPHATTTTAAINAAISAAKNGGLGGEVYIPAGLYFINGTISLDGYINTPSGSGLTIRGERPRYFFDNLSAIQFVGTWLAWYDSNISNTDTGPMISVFDTQDLSFDKIGLYGNSSPTTIVGIKIFSNNSPSTLALNFSNFNILSTGIGIDWGDGLNNHQADHTIMDHFTISSCGIGIRVNGGNAGDFSEIRSGAFFLNTVAIDLLVSGSLKITSCSAGGNPGFIFIRNSGFHTQLIVENCQAEEATGDGYFFYVPKTTIGYPTTSNDSELITFIGNTVNTIVEINTVQRIIGIGNIYENESAPPNLIRLWAHGIKYMGWGERLRVPTTVSTNDGVTQFFPSFHNQRGSYASSIGETVVEGEIIWTNSTAPISPTNIGSLVTTSGITGTDAVVQPFSVNYTGTGNPNNVVSATVGSIYVDTGGSIGTILYVKESGSGNTGWRLITNDVINVKTFGAKGDGTTDDTAAIQAAVTASFSNGRRVLFPGGDYRVTSQITIPEATTLIGIGDPPGGIMGTGNGYPAILHDFDGYLFVFNGAHGSGPASGGGVEGLRMVQVFGTPGNAYGSAIVVTGSDVDHIPAWIKIRNCVIEETLTDGYWTWGIIMDGKDAYANQGTGNIFMSEVASHTFNAAGGALYLCGVDVIIDNCQFNLEGNVTVTGTPLVDSAAVTISNTTMRHLFVDYAYYVVVTGGIVVDITTTANTKFTNSFMPGILTSTFTDGSGRASGAMWYEPNGAFDPSAGRFRINKSILFPNNEYLYGFNFAGSGIIPMIGTDGNNDIVISRTGGHNILLGAVTNLTSSAASDIVIPHAVSFRSQNNAGNDTYNLIKSGASDDIITIGQATKSTAVQIDVPLFLNAGMATSGLTTTGVTIGLAGYMSSTNTVSLTDATAIVSSRVFGINEGISGAMTVSGTVAAAKFTTAGDSPSVGAPVYLAPATEEASAAGKLTATKPTTAGQVVAEVGIVMDNSNYAGSKTAKILLQVKAPIQL